MHETKPKPDMTSASLSQGQEQIDLYLRGALSEVEEEQLELRMLGDSKFFQTVQEAEQQLERKLADQNQAHASQEMSPEQDQVLIDRYLRGKLSAEEQDQFEIRMLAKKELFEQVRETEQFIQGLRDHADLIAEDNVVTPPASYWRQSPLALAASLFIGMLISAMFFNISNDGGSDSGLALSSVVRLEPTRGETNDTHLDRNTPHLLQVDTGLSLSPAPWQLSLASESGARNEYEMMADGNGMLNFVTPTGLQGTWTLSISQQGNDAVTEYVLVFD